MNTTLSIDSGNGRAVYHGHFTLDDIRTIHATLLYYNKNFASNIKLPSRTNKRLHKLIKVFGQYGGEADAICTH